MLILAIYNHGWKRLRITDLPFESHKISILRCFGLHLTTFKSRKKVLLKKTGVVFVLKNIPAKSGNDQSMLGHRNVGFMKMLDTQTYRQPYRYTDIFFHW